MLLLLDDYPFMNEYKILLYIDLLCFDGAALYLIDMDCFRNDEFLVTSCTSFLEWLVGFIFFLSLDILH